VEEEPPGAEPLVLAAGAYEGQGPEQHLLPGPTWTRMAVSPVPTADRLVLDLRTGVLLREETGAAGVPLRSLRLASCARPGVCLLRAEAGALRLRSEAAGWDACAPAAASADDEARDYLAVAVAERTYRHARGRTVERFVGLAHDSSRRAARAVARQRADAAAGRGFEQLLADQRAVWAQRWREVDVRIPHDPAAQLALRYALHQLWSHTSSAAELAVGARGLTGPGYSGHVFWDADVFVLPALTTIDPPSAAAMLRYRARRLDAAARAATRQGRAGARFPWESARSGEDVTPAEAVLAGQRIPVRTGTQEEHITADVAWAAQFHREWTGRRSTPEDPVSLLVLEAARYWASRCRVDGSGTAHIDGVIGPDEYHENVVDNAYTNVMARWNLRRGAAHLEAGGERPHPEAVAWRRIAGALVDGYDPATGRYEQFRGYFDLPDLTVADLGRPPLAADLLLGAEGVAATQIIKQPDVLMLHHLVPDEVAPGSLRPNLDYYLPRTAHGSSLSPAISASLLARAGRADEALELLRLALRLDLDDVTGTTAAGLHLATLGGVWQCVLFGFAGARVVNGCLEVTPSLPSAWPELELRFLALGARVRLRIDGRQIRLRSDRDLLVDVEQAGIRRVADGEQLCVERRVKT
jgi:trehalose/maltose hydrolase-like predicted phosphorylase